MSSINIQYLKSLFEKAIAVPTGFTPLELTLILAGLLVIGLALIFRGNMTWKIIFTVAGLYLGGYFAYNIVHTLGLTQVPVIVAVAIGAVIGAVILTFVVRLGLSAGFGYLVYIVAIDVFHIQFYYALGGAVIGFGIAYILYKDFVHVVAGIVGAFAVYYALIKLGVAPLYAESAAAFAYVVGVAVQEWEKRRKKRLRKDLKEEKEEVREGRRDKRSPL